MRNLVIPSSSRNYAAESAAIAMILAILAGFMAGLLQHTALPGQVAAGTMFVLAAAAGCAISIRDYSVEIGMRPIYIGQVTDHLRYGVISQMALTLARDIDLNSAEEVEFEVLSFGKGVISSLAKTIAKDVEEFEEVTL